MTKRKRGSQWWLQAKVALWRFGLWWKMLIISRRFVSALDIFKTYRQLQEAQKRNQTLRKHFLGDVRFYLLTQKWFELWPHALACASGVIVAAFITGFTASVIVW